MTNTELLHQLKKLDIEKLLKYRHKVSLVFEEIS